MVRELSAVLTAMLLVALPVAAQESPAPVPPAAPVASARALVPLYPNASCPIMGKPVSTGLFAESPKGRIYVCCKSCIKDIHEDAEVAYRSAYPKAKSIANTLCPVSGDAIPEGAPKTVLQGFEFFVHAPEHVAAALADSQVVLAKLNDPQLVDLGNARCPLTDQPVVPNAFVVIEGQVVRLSSSRLLEDIARDPAKVLARAKEIAAQQAAEKAASQPRDG